MRVLFISRAYPPIIGGIENQNEAISRWLSTVAECELIVNTRGKRWLPIFIPLAIVRGLWSARGADVILLGDGVVSIIGWWVKLVYPEKRLVCILHGLDVTYSNSIYQMLWVKIFFTQAMQAMGKSLKFAIICCSAFI